MRGLARTIILSICLGGCAFSGSVQRIGVEYNDAVAGMANELTLLNIMRAREDLPLHYTAVSRLSGSLTLKAGGNINTALRADGTTDTNQTVTTTSAAPSNAVTVAKQIVEGVDVVTPTVSGEINTGPSFDIAILDTQKFYNGVLGAIPFSTVENYISQGFSDQLLMRLLIERIDFKYASGSDKGKIALSWMNAPFGNEAKIFSDGISCYELRGRPAPKKPVDLAPASRLRRADSSTAVGLTLQELALLDGKALELSDSLSASPNDDYKVMVRRPASDKRVADLILKSECRDPTQSGRPIPKSPPSDPVYLGNDKAIVLGTDQRSDVTIDVEPTITFRSTESVIRFVGRYSINPQPDTYFDGTPLFKLVSGRPPGSIVSSTVLGQRYSIANDANRRRNMQVIAIIQQLLNLHKESSERPVTVPVQVIGGS